MRDAGPYPMVGGSTRVSAFGDDLKIGQRNFGARLNGSSAMRISPRPSELIMTLCGAIERAYSDPSTCQLYSFVFPNK